MNTAPVVLDLSQRVAKILLLDSLEKNGFDAFFDLSTACKAASLNDVVKEAFQDDDDEPERSAVLSPLVANIVAAAEALDPEALDEVIVATQVALVVAADAHLVAFEGRTVDAAE